MPPQTLISLNVIVCEKILFEQDQIYSAVRIVDVFYFRRDANLPIESQPIPLCILVSGKTQPEDKAEHSVQLVLVRPNGESTPIGEPLRAVFEAVLKEQGRSLLVDGSKESDIAGGFTVRAEINIVPRAVGRHQIEVFLDDILVARTPFTILELKPRTND